MVDTRTPASDCDNPSKPSNLRTSSLSATPGPVHFSPPLPPPPRLPGRGSRATAAGGHGVLRHVGDHPQKRPQPAEGEPRVAHHVTHHLPVRVHPERVASGISLQPPMCLFVCVSVCLCVLLLALVCAICKRVRWRRLGNGKVGRCANANKPHLSWSRGNRSENKCQKHGLLQPETAEEGRKKAKKTHQTKNRLQKQG